MSDTHDKIETTAERVEGSACRSDTLNAVMSFTHDAGGHAAAAYVAGQLIKTTGDVWMAKINANAGNRPPDAGQQSGQATSEK